MMKTFVATICVLLAISASAQEYSITVSGYPAERGRIFASYYDEGIPMTFTNELSYGDPWFQPDVYFNTKLFTTPTYLDWNGQPCSSELARFSDVCVGWTNGTGTIPLSGNSNSVNWLVFQNSTITWIWDCAYKIDKDPSYTNEFNLQEGWYTNGQVVTLTATPPPNYHLGGFSATTNGLPTFWVSTNPVTHVTATDSRSYFAWYEINSYVVTVESLWDVCTPSVGSVTNEHGTSLDFLVHEPVFTNNVARYVCYGWDCNGNETYSNEIHSFSLMLTNHASVTWLWKTQYWFDVSTSNCSVDVSDGWIDNGSNLTINASPSNGYYFSHWEGDAFTNSNPLVISVTTQTTIKAVCKPIPRQFVVSGTPSHQGNPSPYGYGTNIVDNFTVITNSADTEVIDGDTKYNCVGWYGTGSLSDNIVGGNEVVFTITNDSTVTWRWDVDYWLDVQSDANGSTDTIGGWRDSGEVKSITAIPATNYLFSHWTGDIATNQTVDNPISLTMNMPRTIMAHFVLNPDPDDDGMDTEWEMQYFGDTSRDGSGDYDGDTMTDFDEFIAGTNPTNASSLFLIENPSALNSFYFEWQSVSGKLYKVQMSTNLIEGWMNITNMLGTGESMSYYDPADRDNAYYRISVSN